MTVSEPPFDPDSSQIDEAEENVPELSDEPDNDPDDSSEYVEGETQDREGTERPEVDKHPED